MLHAACLQSLFACGKRCLDQGDSWARVTCAIGIKIPVDLTSAFALHINILIIDKSMIRREWKGTINGKGQRNGEEGRTAKQKYCLWTSLEAQVAHRILYLSQARVHAWAEISIASRRRLLRPPCAPQTALHPYPCRGQFVPSSGERGALIRSNSFSPEVHIRVENGGGKTGKEQGVGQRRKRAEERKATCLKKVK